MKYDLRVQIYISPHEGGRGSLELAETQHVELATLSDAAEILVRLQECFEALRSKGIKP